MFYSLVTSAVSVWPGHTGCPRPLSWACLLEAVSSKAKWRITEEGTSHWPLAIPKYTNVQSYMPGTEASWGCLYKPERKCPNQLSYVCSEFAGVVSCVLFASIVWLNSLTPTIFSSCKYYIRCCTNLFGVSHQFIQDLLVPAIAFVVFIFHPQTTRLSGPLFLLVQDEQNTGGIITSEYGWPWWVHKNQMRGWSKIKYVE